MLGESVDARVVAGPQRSQQCLAAPEEQGATPLVERHFSLGVGGPGLLESRPIAGPVPPQREQVGDVHVAGVGLGDPAALERQAATTASSK